MSRASGLGPQLLPPRPRVSAKMPNSTFAGGGSSAAWDVLHNSSAEYGIAANANRAPRVANPITPLVIGYARSVFDYPQNGLRRFSAATPHRTVRAVFPHTALRVGLVSSVSLPFASRLRFTLIPMDAPPFARPFGLSPRFARPSLRSADMS